MALRSCQKPNVATDALNALLTHQGSWVDLNQEYQNALAILQKEQFVHHASKHFIKCYNPKDVKDSAANPECDNQIYIEDDFDEDCDDLVCDNCGRYILPNSHRKTRCVKITVQLNFHKITQYLERHLGEQQLHFYLLSKGVYTVMSPYGIVTLVLLDICTDHRHLTIDKLKAMPTLILNVRAKIPSMIVEVPIISVADLIHNPLSLTELIKQTCQTGVCEVIPNYSASILPFRMISLAEPKIAPQDKYLEIRMADTGVSINGIVVIGRQASSRLLIFRLLLEQYWQDFEVAKPSAQHTFLNINQLADLMEPHVGMIEDLEQQIRRPLNKMQKVIQDTLAEQLGLPIKRHDVIETHGWPGCNSKQEFGYRLNPNTLLFRK